MAISDVARRIPWTQQPQIAVGIDRANPLAVGCQTLLAVIDGQLRDASNVVPTVDSGTIRAGPNGVSRKYTGGQKTSFANNARYWLTSAMTIAVIVDVDSLTNNTPLLLCRDSASTNGWEIRIGVGTTDSRIHCHRANTADCDFAASAGNTIAAGDKAVFIAVVYSSAAIDVAPTVYVNGTAYTASLVRGTGTGAQTASGNLLDIGGRSGGTTQLDGAIFFAALFNRALTASEIAALRNNPWQLFAPLPRRMRASVAGGLPTLSASTYTPGSLASGGWRPRITAT